MSLKTINFEVKKDGVFPKTVQPAGSQGDHQVTNVVFKLDEGLITGINNLPGDTVFRVRTTDGAGGFHSSEFLTFNGEKRTITFPIEEDVSIPGGIAVLHLVISKIVDQESTDKFFSFPARIKFAGESLGNGSEEQYRKDIDSALLGAKKAEETATSALQEIRILADDTEHAAISVKAVLGADNTYIFDGGKPSEIPSSSVSVKMIVDSELNEQSKNPVENRVVAKKTRELADSVDKIEEDVSSVKEITDEISLTGDYIIETGIKDGWIYEKRNSGICECWRTVDYLAKVPEYEWGNNHYYATLEAVLFPKDLFIEPPVLAATISENSGGNVFLTKNYPTKSNTGTLFIISPVKNDAGLDVSISFIAKGRWK